MFYFIIFLFIVVSKFLILEFCEHFLKMQILSATFHTYSIVILKSYSKIICFTFDIACCCKIKKYVLVDNGC